MKILVIDFVHEVLLDGLTHIGFEVDYQPQMQREEVIAHIPEYEGLVVRTKTNIDRDVLLHAAKLKFIGRAGAGVDNIDTDYCDQHGIHYMNAGEANSDAVGEQTIGMLLGLLAHIVKADKEVRAGIWDREGNRGIELSGKTVGIIGYGNTGKAVAKKLSGFNVKVLAYDKYLTNYGDDFAVESNMDRIFEEVDIITFHVPLTAETKGMVNVSYLERFKKQIFLLNLSRGKVVNLVDLIQAMDSNKVIGSALDVLENEHLNHLNEEESAWFNSLKGSNRVILTPHIGGWTNESYKKISEVLLQKIKELTQC